jgi:catechol 2,3-dioxygenase-like lactoylglutathione lyase family enzyme
VINGAHVIIYSSDSEADRAFLRDVLGLPHVDVGHGWLIFGLPPSEIAVHPAENGGDHELFFMCEDVEALVEGLAGREIACSEIEDLGWGRLTRVTLPGGGKVGIYEPRHERPPQAG